MPIDKPDKKSYNKQQKEVIVETECGDILPSNILLSGAELEFNRPGREFLLKNQLKDVQDDYDFVIIDTPPALNIRTVSFFFAISISLPYSRPDANQTLV